MVTVIDFHAYGLQKGIQREEGGGGAVVTIPQALVSFVGWSPSNMLLSIGVWGVGLFCHFFHV